MIIILKKTIIIIMSQVPLLCRGPPKNEMFLVCIAASFHYSPVIVKDRDLPDLKNHSMLVIITNVTWAFSFHEISVLLQCCIMGLWH